MIRKTLSALIFFHHHFLVIFMGNSFFFFFLHGFMQPMMYWCTFVIYHFFFFVNLIATILVLLLLLLITDACLPCDCSLVSRYFWLLPLRILVTLRFFPTFKSPKEVNFLQILILSLWNLMWITNLYQVHNSSHC